MANATKDLRISHQQDAQIHLTVADGETIYAGTMVMLNLTQKAVRASPSVQGGILIGVAQNRVENSDGTDIEANQVWISQPKVFNAKGSTGDPDLTSPLTQAARGRIAYVFDDNNVVLEPGGGRVAVGVITNVESNGLCAIRPQWYWGTGRLQQVAINLLSLNDTSVVKAVLAQPSAMRLITASASIHAANDADLVLEIVRKAGAQPVVATTTLGVSVPLTTVKFAGLVSNEAEGSPNNPGGDDGFFVRTAAGNANTLDINATLLAEYVTI